MSDFLRDVVERARRRVQADASRFPLEQLKRSIRRERPARSLRHALHHPGRMMLIAEIKQASPSAGLIRRETDFEGRLRAYERGGAAAISILTEEEYFHGSPRLLELARPATRLPVLRKDFIVDPYQVYESRRLGADALLLMASILPLNELRDLRRRTEDLGMQALVEVHDEEELQRALDAGADIVGVNNRDLRSLRVDTATARRLVPLLSGKGKTVVVESGVREPSELREFRSWGAHAVLIGETLMRAADPEAAVRGFAEAGREGAPS